ncbi:alpha/beta hydrolase family protein [Allosalinactinospora lopnorensis]|uniref:alpha/beta hydrolase family protein n=1 Tax=Allosalinactinospora lopnorensis TaxID=1352348 RepID=UPI0009E5AA93|nr:alpha/beta hydrolase family protein [Allosalinactinospora lopnorensis]
MSFVLVHGAGMGADCWHRLAPLLDGEVCAVDLPGRDSRSDVDLRSVTLTDCEQAIVQDVDAAGLSDIVLVAHSFAGVSVSRVMPALASRLRHVVFLSAVVPDDGARVIDQIDPGVRGVAEACIHDGIYHQDRAGAEAMLCNDLGVDDTAWTLDQVVDDCAALLTEPVDLSGLATPVSRTYVRLTKNHCYPPELQEHSSRIVGGDTVFLSAGHMAMVSVPGDVAALVNRLQHDVPAAADDHPVSLGAPHASREARVADQAG